MSVNIEGKSGYPVESDRRGRLHTQAEMISAFMAATLIKGDSYSAVYLDASAAAGDYVAFLKNTSEDRLLIVSQMHVMAANAATFIIASVTGTASGGNSVTPTNRLINSQKVAPVTALADAVGGLTEAGQIEVARVAAASHADLHSDGIVLQPGAQLAVEYDTGTTGAAEAVIDFFMVDPEEWGL